MGLEAFSLEGKLALVTGGGTGIGLGISKAFVEAGARVVITGRRESVLKEATANLGSMADYRVNDINERDKIPHLVDDIEKNIGPIDILVNNAGIHHKAWAQETPDADFERIIQTNLLSVFSLTRECARKMLELKNTATFPISSVLPK